LPRLSELPTPCLVLDRRVFEANCARMKARCEALGVRLRPHLKTAKSVEVAQRAAPEGAITVSTLREAEWFAAAGIRDLLWAVAVVPDKLGRVDALAEAGARVRLVTDDLQVARAIAARARERATRYEVSIEIDVGQHRSGVDPEGPELLEIARALVASERVALRGVLAHAGQAYRARSIEAIRAIAERERALAVRAAERLRAAGFACPEVSVGSTPTITHAVHLQGVTEARPGVYVFGDLFQAALGSCRVEDIALSVLTTVIGVRRTEGVLVIDAGALALSQDRSLDAVGGRGYGEVRDRRGRAWLDRPVVDVVYQEHGLVRLGSIPDEVQVGMRLRILPNHACMTAAAHERYHVVEGEDEEVVAVWDRVNGW